jgi:hypothetical protein
MTNALGRIAALTMQRSGPVLAGLAIIPLLTLALLGVWYVDAQNVADAEAQRIAEERYAKRQAAKLVQQVDDAITERMEDINARFEAGAIEAIRNLYRSDDPVEMVAIYDANGALLFPEAQELRLFSEDTALRRDALRLLAARRVAIPSRVSWVGSIRDRDVRAIACRVFGERTICLLLHADWLRVIAEIALLAGQLVDLAAPALVEPAHVRAVAMLPDPFSGTVVAVDYPVHTKTAGELL